MRRRLRLLLKKTPPARLLEYLQDVMTGGAPMSPEVASRVIALVSRRPAAGTRRAPPHATRSAHPRPARRGPRLQDGGGRARQQRPYRGVPHEAHLRQAAGSLQVRSRRQSPPRPHRPVTRTYSIRGLSWSGGDRTMCRGASAITPRIHAREQPLHEQSHRRTYFLVAPHRHAWRRPRPAVASVTLCLCPCPCGIKDNGQKRRWSGGASTCTTSEQRTDLGGRRAVTDITPGRGLIGTREGGDVPPRRHPYASQRGQDLLRLQRWASADALGLSCRDRKTHLPAGSFAVSAKLTVTNTFDERFDDRVLCSLRAEADVDRAELVLPEDVNTVIQIRTMPRPG